MNLVNAITAESDTLPEIKALGYEYVVSGNGLFVRAEDSRLAALVEVAPTSLHGLAPLTPFVEFRLPRIPEKYLLAILASARRHLPNEAMYQLSYDLSSNQWRVSMPQARATATSLQFEDDANAVMDLHSHGTMEAFFSGTDNNDERGFRVYAVIGKIDSPQPEIIVRVGVYGHHMEIDADLVFEGLGPCVAVPTLLVEEFHPEETGDDPALLRFAYEPTVIRQTPSGLLIAGPDSI